MNLAAVMLFAISAASVAMGVGFGIAVGEEVGAAILIGGGLAAGLAGLAVVLTQGRDVPAPGALGESVSLTPARPSVWPFGLGLAALVLATGLATGSGLVLVGLAAAAVSAMGWFMQSWSNHPTWTDEQNERVGWRLVMPLVIPLGVTALVAVMAVAFSRILLAVPSTTAVLIALAAALVVLGAGSLVAMRGLSRSAVLSLLAAGALATAGLGVGGAVAGEREFHHAGEEAAHDGEEGGEEHAADDPGSPGGEETEPSTPTETDLEPDTSAPSRVELSAEGLQFDKDSLTLAAVEPAVLVFSNEESQPHNVAFRDEGGSVIFRPEGGGIITGPGEEIEYDVPPIEAGEYTFFCEVHPSAMVGDLTVE